MVAAKVGQQIDHRADAVVGELDGHQPGPADAQADDLHGTID